MLKHVLSYSGVVKARPQNYCEDYSRLHMLFSIYCLHTHTAVYSIYTFSKKQTNKKPQQTWLVAADSFLPLVCNPPPFPSLPIQLFQMRSC